jgi:hypothetical protein
LFPADAGASAIAFTTLLLKLQCNPIHFLTRVYFLMAGLFQLLLGLFHFLLHIVYSFT